MAQDEFNRKWIIANALEEIPNYAKGVLTIRGLHYRLVSRGMTNSMRHYKRVVAAMIQARWEGIVDFDQFSDNDRETIGFTDWRETVLKDEIQNGKTQIKLWMQAYHKNRWENQELVPEIWIEKKALQGVFLPVAREFDVALAPCKGYPSLTFLHEAMIRFRSRKWADKTPIILYFGDYDPSGEDIPRSIAENVERMGTRIEVRRIALMESQVLDWGLPPAPAKTTDSRTANWDGLGQVELDAVDPNNLQDLARDAIREVLDADLYDDLIQIQEKERKKYRKALKKHVKSL